MMCETNYMQQLWFINSPLAQYVSGIIIAIFRSARPYNTAYGFQHLMCWLVSWDAWKQAVCTRCTQPASQMLKTICRIYGLALLKMDIMMPGTCWANGLLINHNCWSSWSHMSFHIKDARSHEHQTSDQCLCLTFVCAVCDCTHDLPIWPWPFSICTFYHHYPFQHFHRCNYLFLHNLQCRYQFCHLTLVHGFSVHTKNLLTRPQRSSQSSLHTA